MSAVKKLFVDTNPISENKTAEGKFQNRRVEILILSG
jgi:flagellar motor protein MotB